MNMSLSVGIRGECIASGGQPGAYLIVIFDDAACTTEMPSETCGCALRSIGAPCVAQRVGAMPTCPVERVHSRAPLQFGCTHGTAQAFQRPIDHRDAGRGVAAVFQAPQSFQQDRHDVSMRDCGHYAAHSHIPFRLPFSRDAAQRER
jgi:hypothetical protein